MKGIIFFDIDGTLRPKDKEEIPQGTIDVLKEAKKNGYEIVIATGRVYHSAKPFIDAVGATSFIVSNGQDVYYQGQEIYKSYLSEKTKKNLTNYCIKNNINYGVEKHDNIYVVADKNDSINQKLQAHGIDHVKFAKPEIIKDEKIFQFWIFDQNPEAIIQITKDINSIAKTVVWERNIEIMEHDESKALGIKHLMPYYNQEGLKTFAFGDGNNDLEMIDYVDVGIAMDNSTVELKEKANFITKASDDNGIEFMLKKLGIINE